MTELELLRQQNAEWARKLGNAQAIRNALAVLARVCLSLDAAHDPETGLYYAVKQTQEALKRSGNSEEVQRAIFWLGGVAALILALQVTLLLCVRR